MSAQQRLARRRVALRERIEKLGDPDILALQEERDTLWMNYEMGREVHSEWAVMARGIAPREDGCKCDICAISFALKTVSEAGKVTE